MNIAVKVFSSDLCSQDEQRRIVEGLNLSLIKTGYQLIRSNSNDVENFLLLTGGIENNVWDHIKSHHLSDKRIALMAHNNNNSLPAVLETASFLQQEGMDVKIIILESSDICQELDKLMSENNILNGQRVGLIGKPSDWLVASSQSSQIVSNEFGLEIVEIGMSELYELLDYCETDKMPQEKFAVVEPDKKQLIEAVNAYEALKMVVRKYRLDGLTIRCFDLVMEKGITACYALGRLNLEGIAAGCEGDIASITGMMCAKRITGKIPWMANVARIDADKGCITLSHCTAPLQYLQNTKFRSHFETGKSVALAGDLDLDKVTIFRLGGRKLHKLWISQGKFMRSLEEESLCRTQAEFVLPQESLRELLKNPLGNHLLVVPGWVKADLQRSGIAF